MQLRAVGEGGRRKRHTKGPNFPGRATDAAEFVRFLRPTCGERHSEINPDAGRAATNLDGLNRSLAVPRAWDALAGRTQRGNAGIPEEAHREYFFGSRDRLRRTKRYINRDPLIAEFDR